MPRLNLSNDYRVGCIGRTGTGKTFLMEKLLESQPKVIVVDSKHRVRWNGYHLTNDPTAALLQDKTIYRPYSGIPPESFWEVAMDTLHEKGGGIIYCDELPVIASANRIPPGMAKVFRLGREIGVGLWWSGQESVGVPNTAIRQCDILLLFMNIGASDRDKLINTTGDMGEATKDLGFYEFMVFQSHGQAYDPANIPVYKYEIGV